MLCLDKAGTHFPGNGSVYRFSKSSSKTIGLSRHPLENDLGRCIRLQLFRSVELISVIANLPIASVANHFPNLVAKL